MLLAHQIISIVKIRAHAHAYRHSPKAFRLSLCPQLGSLCIVIAPLSHRFVPILRLILSLIAHEVRPPLSTVSQKDTEHQYQGWPHKDHGFRGFPTLAMQNPSSLAGKWRCDTPRTLPADKPQIDGFQGKPSNR